MSPPDLDKPLLRAWRRLFLNRSLPYALQQRDGAYRWIQRRCRSTVVQAHLAGGCTVALSSRDPAGWCRWVCLDVDATDGLPQLVRLADALTYWGFPGLLEASRRGGHLWLFLEAPSPATLARSALLGVLRRVAEEGVTVPPIEIYPDASASAFLGHAVRLPLGVHQKTGLRYPLLNGEGKPFVFPTIERAQRYCLEVPRVPTQWLRFGWSEPAIPHHTGEHTGMTSPQPGTTSPVIRWVDATISPLDLLAEYVPESAMHQAGKGYLGWCSFHDDQAPQEDGSPGTPSFYVVRDAVYGWSWRCLSTNCRFHAGSMKHTFRLYYELLGSDPSNAIPQAARRWPESESFQ